LGFVKGHLHDFKWSWPQTAHNWPIDAHHRPDNVALEHIGLVEDNYLIGNRSSPKRGAAAPTAVEVELKAYRVAKQGRKAAR